MKKQTYLITLSIITIFLIVFLFIYNLSFGIKLNIKQGQFKFTKAELTDIYYLNGEWELYNNILLATENLNPQDYSFTYETLPTRKKTNQEKLSYRLVISNFPQNVPTTIDFQNLAEGYSIYLNRNLIKCNYRENICLHYYTLSEDDELEIIIEIDNRVNGFSNIIDSPLLLSYHHYRQKRVLQLINSFITIGFLFFTIIFIAYIHKFQDFRKEAIYYALTIFFAILNLFFSPKLVNILNIPFVLSFYIYHLSLFLMTVFLYLFIRKYANKNHFTVIDFSFLTIIIIVFLLTGLLPLNILSANIIFIKSFNVIALTLVLIYIFFYARKIYYFPFIAFIIALLIGGNIYTLLRDDNLIFSSVELETVIYFSMSLIYTAIITLSHTDKIASAEEFVRLNEKIRDTEFTFLNSQIQSHFIYNALNSIQSLCLIEPLKAADLIENFSTYLRLRLEFNKMPILIEFADELDYIKTYINIEKERFGDRIKIQYNIQIGEFKIPPLSVQPLVENAIKHGLSKKPQGGTITISTLKDDAFVYVIIEDDGVGFDPKSLSEKQRVGTANIQHRLSLHLNASLEIKSEINVGTKSIIKIPIEKALM